MASRLDCGDALGCTSMESGNITTAEGFRSAYAEIFANVACWRKGSTMSERCCPPAVPAGRCAITSLTSPTWRSILGRAIGGSSTCRRKAALHPQPAWRVHGDRCDARRDMPVVRDLLAEYRVVNRGTAGPPRRAHGFAARRDGPRVFFGESKVRSLLAIRVFDLWAHEQDIRRALGETRRARRCRRGAQRERMLIGAAHELQERITRPPGR